MAAARIAMHHDLCGPHYAVDANHASALAALEVAVAGLRDFLTIAAPVRVMSFTPQLWSTYVKFGESKAIKNDQGHYIGECTGIPEAFLEWVCGAWLGFVPTTIEVAGAKNVRGSIAKRWTDPAKPGEFGLHCEVLYTK